MRLRQNDVAAMPNGASAYVGLALFGLWAGHYGQGTQVDDTQSEASRRISRGDFSMTRRGALAHQKARRTRVLYRRDRAGYEKRKKK